MTVDIVARRAYIAGELRDGRGAARDIENPATGEVVAVIPDASDADIDAAVTAAVEAQTSWGRRTYAERSDVLRELATALDARVEELAAVIVAEVGKPIREAEDEARGVAGFFRFAASLAETIADEIRYSRTRGERILLQRRPHGVVGAIIPWNYPGALTARKLAPALAAGNGVVLKADEKTPLSALLIAEVLAASSLPSGLVSILCGGADVGRYLVRHPGTAMITMTGSAAAGKAILADAAPAVKPVSLELGGKAPFIVMGDADLDLAVAAAVRSRHANNGQVCIAAERVFVHDRVYEDFTGAYVSAVERLVVGDPSLRSTDIGPKISAAELSKSVDAIDVAVAAGASVRLGGGRLTDGPFAAGHWMQPTVVTDVSPQMAIMRQETFGPVTPIMRFTSWQDVAQASNDSPYGLSAYVYTADLGAAMTAMDDLDFGEVYINRVGPEELNGFHVGYRESGLGGDDGAHGLDLYFRRQTVYLNAEGAWR
jgi:lactaldehyde dehydrogenase / glycolaldehyde dehydrogenase